MANEEQLSILKQGVKVWNEWRMENPDQPIDLEGARLHGQILSLANFREANLRSAVNFCEWYLMHMDYRGERTKQWSGVECEKGDCFLRTFELHEEFWRDFLEKVPDEGKVIPYADLKNWFDEHL